MPQFFVGLAIYWTLGTLWFLIELRLKDAPTRAKYARTGPGLVALYVLVEGLLHLPYLALRGVGWAMKRWLVPVEEAAKADPASGFVPFPKCGNRVDGATRETCVLMRGHLGWCSVGTEIKPASSPAPTFRTPVTRKPN